MRIAEVTKYYHPHRGGIESHVQGISEVFADRGHDVTVFTSDSPPSKKEETNGRIRIIRSDVWFTLFNGPFIPGILSSLMREDYDAIHLHLPDPATSIFALIASKAKRKPLFVTYHADIIKDMWYHKPFTLAYGLFQNLVLLGAEKIIATTPNYVRDSQIPGRYRKKVVIAPNFVDASKFNPHNDGTRIRRELHLEGKKVLFFLGRLIPYKGVEYVIRAFAKVKEQNRDAVLIIGGRGPLERELKRLARDLKVEDVIFTRIEDDVIPEYYAACDVFVMPSINRAEAFGIALLEAMATGKPTITTDISGMPYVVGDAGMTIEPRDVDALSDAMNELLSDEKLGRDLGERARERVESEFTKEKVAERILSVMGAGAMKRSNFKWDAEYYRNNSRGQQKWAQELMAKLKLKGDERLLDIGCGDGRNTAEIAALLPKGSALGLDYSCDMIALAKKTFPSSQYGNLDYVACNALEMDYDSEFDYVFSNAALHWIKDHETLLKRISRALKPGGRILLQMGGRGNAKKVFDILEGMTKEEKWKDHFKDYSSPFGFYTPEEYEPWMTEAGLKKVRLELLDRDMTYKGRVGFYGFIKSTWLPYTQRVPEGMREGFINQVVDTYLKENPADDEGVIHVAMKRLEVEAVKE